MSPALKPSQRAAVVGSIDPQSAAAVKTTGWIDASQYANFLAVIGVGAITAGGLVDANILQATSNAGAGAKAVPGKAIVQIAAGSVQALINFKQDDLDVNNGFSFVQVSVTPSVAASLIDAKVFGFDPRYGPADGYAAATQTQIVG